VNAALFATIWLALSVFVACEAVKLRRLSGRSRAADGLRLWMLGALLFALHMAIALGFRYGWNHEAAARETARQTQAVFGVSWGGGVYVNYLFVAIWSVDSWWWQSRPDRYARRPVALTWMLRGFYLIIIFNAAIVFASPVGRLIGIPLVAALLWIWSSRRTPLKPKPEACQA
jgi:hypothetical protein